MMDSRAQKIIDWIGRSAAKANGLLVPVSGGSDSALNYWLCTQAFPEKTVAVHAGTKLRCQKWFKSVGRVEFIKNAGQYSEREEMRWARFLAMSLDSGAWLVGSRNHTEDLLGTYSLASRVATYLPLVNIWKSEVMDICRTVGVPNEIIASSYRADPNCGRPKELAEISFEKIEAELKFLETGSCLHPALGSISPSENNYLEKLIKRNAFKKTLPIRGISL